MEDVSTLERKSYVNKMMLSELNFKIMVHLGENIDDFNVVNASAD
jgi:hypothetical protein